MYYIGEFFNSDGTSEFFIMCNDISDDLDVQQIFNEADQNVVIATDKDGFPFGPYYDKELANFVGKTLRGDMDGY